MVYNPKNIKSKNSRDVNHLHPEVKKLAILFTNQVNEALKGFYEIKVISTLRTFEEQQELYNKGRISAGKVVTNAKPGRSIHNWGCAFDIGVFKDGKYNPTNAENIYKQIGPIGEKLGLTWGGRWKNPVDYPHYQYTGKYSNEEFLNLVNQGKSIDELLDPIGYFINKMNDIKKIEEEVRRMK